MGRRVRRSAGTLGLVLIVLAVAGGADSPIGAVSRSGGQPQGVLDTGHADLVYRSAGRLLVDPADPDPAAVPVPLPLPAVLGDVDPGVLSLSPDGRSLAYACDPVSATPEGEDNGLCTVDLDADGPPTLVTTALAPVHFPAWGSDGRLAFAALDGGGHGSIWVADRGRPGAPAESLCEDWCPLFRYHGLAWSPDGSTIAASADTPGSGGHPARIVLFDVATHDFDFLVGPDGGRQHGPAWSPDGRHIVYSSNAAGSFDLWVAEVASGSAERLTAEPDREVTPAWSPDGRTIVFGARDEQGWHIRSVPATGGPSTVVTRDAQPSAPRFVPVG